MKKFDFEFYKNRKTLCGISIGLMVIGLIFNFIRGTKMDIQFVGGAMIKYSVDGEVDTDEIASLVKEETGRDVSVALSKTFGTDANQVTLSFAGNEAVTVSYTHLDVYKRQIPMRPSLVALTSDDEDCPAMQGLSLRNCGVTVTDNEKKKKPVYTDFGELLFTHFGLSGPKMCIRDRS